jgi:hypothetical protein
VVQEQQIKVEVVEQEVLMSQILVLEVEEEVLVQQVLLVLVLVQVLLVEQEVQELQIHLQEVQ